MRVTDGRVGRLLATAAGVALTGQAMAADINWDAIPITSQSAYQAVNADGSPAYTGGFPVRLYGVVLANTEDWLSPTAAYDSGYHPFQLGGQAEVIVGAVQPGDFGGTFCWMGQNYGNMPWNQIPGKNYSYTNAEWTAELARLGLFGGAGVTTPIRAGDLVEIRAKAGLNYNGKMNVNEQHDNDRLNGHDAGAAVPADGSGAHDFDIVVVQRGYGLPTPAALPLSLIKDAGNVAIFDPTRATGGEHYQTSLVDLKNVKVIGATTWGPNSDVTVQDTSGRTLLVHLGLNSGFNSVPVPGSYFNLVGIVDQASASGKDGYRLLALDPTRIARHGDTDLNGDVSFLDFNRVVANFTGFAGTGKTWAEGNFNEAENASIDFNDFNAAVANFTGFGKYRPVAEVSAQFAAQGVSVASGPDAGAVQLLVDVATGKLSLLGNAAQVSSWDIYSPSGALVADGDGSASPWVGYLINNTTEAAAYVFGSSVTVDGEMLLGPTLAPGHAVDLMFLYAGTNGNPIQGSVVIVPEPAMVSMLALAGGLAALRRRRRHM